MSTWLARWWTARSSSYWPHTTTIWQLLDLAAEISCNKLFVMKWQDFTKTNQLVFITKETLQKQIWYIKVLHFFTFSCLHYLVIFILVPLQLSFQTVEAAAAAANLLWESFERLWPDSSQAWRQAQTIINWFPVFCQDTRHLNREGLHPIVPSH